MRIHPYNPLLKRLLWCWVVVGVFFVWQNVQAAVPPLGYEIISQSSAEYTQNGFRHAVRSNPATTPVGPFFQISLTPAGTVASPAYSLFGFEADTVQCGFVVRNLGNVADSISVDHAILSASTIGISDVVFYHDSNGNSAFDPGEEDRSFLNLGPGESTDLGTMYVLTSGQGGGDSYVDISAATGVDTLERRASSVVHILTQADPVQPLHVGPLENAKALPGGEGSPDDVTRRSVGVSTQTLVFENEILNDGRDPDIIRIEPADSTGWPPGVQVTVRDSAGNGLRTVPASSGAVLLGQLESGERRTLQVHVTTEDESFYHVGQDSLSIRLRARSLLDTTRTNETIDRIVLAEPFNPSAVLSLEQTFKENTAAFGDIVTLVVAVANRSDSVRADNVVVDETVQPTLEFLSSPDFELDGKTLAWQVGSLAPGERRQAVIKFVANSRVKNGWTKITGNAVGTALARNLYAGPVVNALKIANDMFGDEGFLLGDVFVDANKNGKRDHGERGLPRVGVFLESGEYALTDSTGRFSVPWVFSGFRVIRIDESTLAPDIVDIEAISTKTNAVFGTERLVHMIPSGHAVVSFPMPERARERPRVSRQISCQEMVSIRKQQQALYRMPSIPSSLFEIGKSYLKTGTLHYLNPIVEFLEKNPGWIVYLEGHTDSIPIHNAEFASNQELSEARAGAVKRYLSAKGIPQERIVARGHGDTTPVATNTTREGRAENRRVEVSFVPPGTGVEDHAEIDRVEADMSNVTTVADSFHVFVIWGISSDAIIPVEIDLALEIPDVFDDAKTRVTCGGEDRRSRWPICRRWICPIARNRVQGVVYRGGVRHASGARDSFRCRIQLDGRGHGGG